MNISISPQPKRRLSEMATPTGNGGGLESMSGPDLVKPKGTDVQSRQFRAARAANILEHRSLLDIYSDPVVPRLTSIICTIGKIKMHSKSSCHYAMAVSFFCSWYPFYHNFVVVVRRLPAP